MPAAPRSSADLNFPVNVQLHPSPPDWRDQFIYFLLVDRFDNNDPTVPAFTPADAGQGRDIAQRNRFQGGNIKGITRRLDYLQGLGCSAVWLSPILKNRQDSRDSYHGYGIQDFLQVDPRFGTLADLRELTTQAHARGMYVILDVVINHSGDVWGYPGDFPYYYAQGEAFPFGFWRKQGSTPPFGQDDAIWPIELQTPAAFKRRGQIRDWYDEIEARDGDFLSLKELSITHPAVLDTLIKIHKYWIASADLDGFRIDTVKHLENSATAIFCNAIREYTRRIGKHNFFLFGEIVSDDATIQKYLGRNSRIEGTNERFPALDAALDFPLYFSLEEVIKGLANPAALRQRYESFRTHYADHGAAGSQFVSFVDNHDQMARPYRRFMHGNPFPQQAVLAIGYLLTSSGVPCIYYGTEQGFDGGGPDDAYVRECLFGGTWGGHDSGGRHCFNPAHEIYQGISAIAQTRSQSPALRYGRQYFREISGDGNHFGHPLDGRCTLAYSRILDTDELLVALNLDSAPRNDFITVDRSLNPPGTPMRDLLEPTRTFSVEDRAGRSAVRVDLPRHGVAILQAV
ncbi:MAG: alpha-amylase family glycosyl hydrolase [Burkholderiales bacterium]|nr:alpha-amylase family glycosyl hydrolase [Burkholderiales bacterium]